MREFVCPCKGCLSIWPHDTKGHNKDVVSTWKGVCDVLYQIREKVPNAI